MFKSSLAGKEVSTMLTAEGSDDSVRCSWCPFIVRVNFYETIAAEPLA